MEKNWKRTGDVRDRIEYRSACRQANRLIRESRRKFFEDRIHASSDSKQRWSTIKQLLHPRGSQSTCGNNNGTAHFSEILSSYFVDKIKSIKNEISKKLAGLVPDPFAWDVVFHGEKLVDLNPVSPTEVLRLPSSLPGKTSPLDVIPTSLLKNCTDIFVPIIVRLANLSFGEGKFPSKFARAQVTPILKKDGLDPEIPSNYRPISNLNTLSKILERLFLSRLKIHINNSGRTNMYQSAYKQYHNTEMAVLKILDDIYAAVDDKKVTCLAALDLSAAFDTLEHEKLLARLRNSYGLDGSALSWITTYLHDRSQWIKYDDVVSPSTKCEFGIPQGSVLGPILFSLFVAPIADLISSHGLSFHQFADDTQLYVSVIPKSPQTSLVILDKCSRALLEWFSNNGLALNLTKSEVLFCGTRANIDTTHQIRSVLVAGCETEPSDTIKSLGITLDGQLSFDKHVDGICRTAHFHIRALKHIRRTLSVDCAKSVSSAFDASLGRGWTTVTEFSTVCQPRTLKNYKWCRTLWRVL